MNTANQQRISQLRRIHVAKKQLDLDDDVYRSLLMRVGGNASSANMTHAQRNAVIAALVSMGFKEADRKERRMNFPGRPKTCDLVPMLRKVEALLTDSKRPWSYAHAMSKQMFKVARVEWLRHDQLHSLVSALQVDANRRGK